MNGAWFSIVVSLLAAGVSLGSVYSARKARLRYERGLADFIARGPDKPDWWTEGPGPGEA